MHNIKYVHFDEHTGYGAAASSLISCLRQTGVNLSTFGIKPGEVEKGGIKDATTECMTKFDAVIIHTVPEYFPYWYQHEKKNNPAVPVWGYTAWETDQIPRHWIGLLNLMDGILVPCKWNKSVFKRCGVTSRIEVLPHVSEFRGEVNNAEASTLASVLSIHSGSFLFYTIGVWNERKNIETLIRAFTEEFSDDEDVALLIKTGEKDWSDYKRNWRKLFRWDFGSSSNSFSKLGFTDRKNLIHIGEDLPVEDISYLHKLGNCFVSFSRGEGWGMGAYEAAWFAKPVIATGFGGFLDFLPERCSYHLKYKMTSVYTKFGKKSYESSQQWADVDIAHAKRIMRQVFENQKEASKKGIELQEYVMEQFAPAAIAEKCINILKGEKR